MKIILFANTGWYLFNFRLSLARALQGRFLCKLLVPSGNLTFLLFVN